MESSPAWLRVWVLSGLLGGATGVTCGIGLLGVMFVTGGIDNGFYSDASAGFVVGFVLCVVMGAAVGGLVGVVFGLLSGAIAGPVFGLLQRVVRPAVAAVTAVALVLLLQTIAGLLIVEPRVWWTAFIVPAISVVPLVLAVRRVKV